MDGKKIIYRQFDLYFVEKKKLQMFFACASNVCRRRSVIQFVGQL